MKIHYIDPAKNDILIIAFTPCGIHAMDCNEYTNQRNEVTCKRCIQAINKKEEKEREKK